MGTNQLETQAQIAAVEVKCVCAGVIDVTAAYVFVAL